VKATDPRLTAPGERTGAAGTNPPTLDTEALTQNLNILNPRP